VAGRPVGSERFDGHPGALSAGPDDGDGCEQGVLPVLLDPVGDFVEQIGLEATLEGERGEDGVLDASVFLAAALDLRQMLRQQGSVLDPTVPAELGQVELARPQRVP
jgi:hypothetical protein